MLFLPSLRPSLDKLTMPFDHIDTLMFCDFVTRWPTLAALRRASRKTLESFFHTHNCRRAGLIDGRLKSIRGATALTDDPGIVVPYRLHALALVAQLRAALAAIDLFDEEIAALARTLKFLRQTFVEWASQTINKSFWAGTYYRQQRAKGSSYQAAVRALAFKWIRILYRCWQTGTRYDESIYLNALRKRGSPLLRNLGLPG